MNHEYAFDVKLAAVVRVVADSQAKAVEAILRDIIEIDLNFSVPSTIACMRLTEASIFLEHRGGSISLFEIDGDQQD